MGKLDFSLLHIALVEFGIGVWNVKMTILAPFNAN